jgi:hypothetical protein
MFTTRQSVTGVVVVQVPAGCRSGWLAAGEYSGSIGMQQDLSLRVGDQSVG